MEQAPDAFARVGAPIFLDEGRVSSREITALLTEALTKMADELRADVLAFETSKYHRVLEGKGSINRIWDRVVKLVKRDA